MPDAVELLVLCIDAGCSPTQAVVAVAARAPPAVRPVFAEVERVLHRGRSLAEALDALTASAGSLGREVAARHRRRRSRRAAAGSGPRPAGHRRPRRPSASRRGRGPAAAGAPDVPARAVHVALLRAPRHRAGRARRPLDAAGERPVSVLHPVDERNHPVPPTLLALAVRLQTALSIPMSSPPNGRRRGAGDDGQATTEYALVLLAAALVALLVDRVGDGRAAARPRSAGCSTGSSTPSSTRCELRWRATHPPTTGVGRRRPGGASCRRRARPGRGRAGTRAAGGGAAPARDAAGGARRPRPAGHRAGGSGGRPGGRRLGRSCGGRPAGCRAGHVAAAPAGRREHRRDDGHGDGAPPERRPTWRWSGGSSATSSCGRR